MAAKKIFRVREKPNRISGAWGTFQGSNILFIISSNSFYNPMKHFDYYARLQVCNRLGELNMSTEGKPLF